MKNSVAHILKKNKENNRHQTVPKQRKYSYINFDKAFTNFTVKNRN